MSATRHKNQQRRIAERRAERRAAAYFRRIADQYDSESFQALAESSEEVDDDRASAAALRVLADDMDAGRVRLRHLPAAAPESIRVDVRELLEEL